jgi:hypothetical protein
MPIPMIQMNFPPFSAKSDNLSVNLPGAPRATLPVFTGGDAAVVRGVRADRGYGMGHMSPLSLTA